MAMPPPGLSATSPIRQFAGFRQRGCGLAIATFVRAADDQYGIDLGRRKRFPDGRGRPVDAARSDDAGAVAFEQRAQHRRIRGGCGICRLPCASGQHHRDARLLNDHHLGDTANGEQAQIGGPQAASGPQQRGPAREMARLALHPVLRGHCLQDVNRPRRSRLCKFRRHHRIGASRKAIAGADPHRRAGDKRIRRFGHTEAERIVGACPNRFGGVNGHAVDGRAIERRKFGSRHGVVGQNAVQPAGCSELFRRHARDLRVDPADDVLEGPGGHFIDRASGHADQAPRSTCRQTEGISWVRVARRNVAQLSRQNPRGDHGYRVARSIVATPIKDCAYSSNPYPGNGHYAKCVKEQQVESHSMPHKH